MKIIGRGLSALCILALAACASAQTDPPDVQPASAVRGLAYAQQACAGCHGVTASQPVSPNPMAPSFVVVANTPGMTATALNAWLHSAHELMPNLIVAPEDRDDLSAYLEALRTGAHQG